MTGYKKCIYFDKKDDDYQVLECIVELEIPDDAKIVRPFFIEYRTNKLRCDKAIVEAIFSYDEFGNYYRLPDDTVAYSAYNIYDFVDNFRNENLTEVFKDAFTYIIGETVTPEYDLNVDEDVECCSGIHFFEKIEEAAEYKGLWPFIIRIVSAYFNTKYDFVWFNDRKD